MAQKWYTKATVQAAIVGGVFVLLAAIVLGLFSLYKVHKGSSVGNSTEQINEKPISTDSNINSRNNTKFQKITIISPFKREKINRGAPTALTVRGEIKGFSLDEISENGLYVEVIVEGTKNSSVYISSITNNKTWRVPEVNCDVGGNTPVITAILKGRNGEKLASTSQTLIMKED